MGTIQHHAIVATSYNEGTARIAAATLSGLGCKVIGPCMGQVNGYSTLCIVPDGSKEGWKESDAGNKRRDAAVQVLERYGLEYAEVSFGECGAELCRSNCADVTL